jgi:hypothetical protein
MNVHCRGAQERVGGNGRGISVTPVSSAICAGMLVTCRRHYFHDGVVTQSARCPGNRSPTGSFEHAQ